MARSPTIILVHGALTGGLIWDKVAPRLHARGHDTWAPAPPLRGLASDVDYLAAFLDTVEGPTVLVGHSYGGSVISHPALGRFDVKGLVFVAAFAPDAGESTGELNGRWPGGKLGEATTVTRTYPGGTDLYLRPDAFAEVYAGDLPAETVQVLARSQRPIDVAALVESFKGEPLWRTTPSWTLISTQDASLVPPAQRAMAERAGARTADAPASHAAPLSQPDAVADIILAAA